MDVRLLCLLALYVLLFLFRVNLIIANKWHIYMPNTFTLLDKKKPICFFQKVTLTVVLMLKLKPIMILLKPSCFVELQEVFVFCSVLQKGRC